MASYPSGQTGSVAPVESGKRNKHGEKTKTRENGIKQKKVCTEMSQDKIKMCVRKTSSYITRSSATLTRGVIISSNKTKPPAPPKQYGKTKPIY
jgi:hypothetical protein